MKLGIRDDAMDAGGEDERKHEVRQLRVDIDRLRFLHVALDTSADRGVILATSKELRERQDRLAQLESPGWID